MASNIARWDGTTWTALGTGVTGWVAALTSFDDGGGRALYAGGYFTHAGGLPVNGIAKWDGTTWSALTGGVSGGSEYGPSIWALSVWDDGVGPAIYAGGNFSSAGSVSASCIARWDGRTWSSLGAGLAGCSDTCSSIYGGNDPSSPCAAFVYAIAPFDDLFGPALYVGGSFQQAGVNSAFSIARWDGQSWRGLRGEPNGAVNALAVFNDGSGPALYVGGTFTRVAGRIMNSVAKWDRNTWFSLGSGLTAGFTCPRVLAFAEFNDGTGPALYAGGVFDDNHVRSTSIVKWERQIPQPGESRHWKEVASGVAGGVLAMEPFDDGSHPALYIGGSFGWVLENPWTPILSDGLARYTCVRVPTLPGDVNLDGVADMRDVHSFLLTLLIPDVWHEQWCAAADMNLDNVVDGHDIGPFVALLTRP